MKALCADRGRDPIFVGEGQHSPAVLEGGSCVYVLHIVGGVEVVRDVSRCTAHSDIDCQVSREDRLYVGETESLRQRLKEHRARYKKEGCTVSCLAASAQSKSHARQVETQLIRRLLERGALLESTGDASHSLFGKVTDSSINE